MRTTDIEAFNVYIAALRIFQMRTLVNDLTCTINAFIGYCGCAHAARELVCERFEVCLLPLAS